MKKKRSSRSKKGFSAIIASLILMLLAVAAGVVVYAYVMGWIGSATSNPHQNGHLSIDSIYANTTGSTITIYIRNVGGSNLLLSNIYVGGSLVANKTTALPATGFSLPVQSVAHLVVTQTMTVSQFYTVQVACKDGTMISESVQAQ